MLIFQTYEVVWSEYSFIEAQPGCGELSFFYIIWRYNFPPRYMSFMHISMGTSNMPNKRSWLLERVSLFEFVNEFLKIICSLFYLYIFYFLIYFIYVYINKIYVFQKDCLEYCLRTMILYPDFLVLKLRSTHTCSETLNLSIYVSSIMGMMTL